MKANIGRRILLIVHWLISLLLVAAIGFCAVTGYGLETLKSRLGSYSTLVLVVCGVAYLLLSLAVAVILFTRGRKKDDRGFVVVDSSDKGRIRISTSAVDQMVQEAAASVEGLIDMKSVIESADDSVDVRASITIERGAHVPTVSLELQRSIRQYVEMNCGVQVHEVIVSIISVTDPAGGRKLRSMIPNLPQQGGKVGPKEDLTALKPEETGALETETVPEQAAEEPETEPYYAGPQKDMYEAEDPRGYGSSSGEAEEAFAGSETPADPIDAYTKDAVAGINADTSDGDAFAQDTADVSPSDVTQEETADWNEY